MQPISPQLEPVRWIAWLAGTPVIARRHQGKVTMKQKSTATTKNSAFA